MKYGLIYFQNTCNIGDDILSYAGKQFLPQVDYYIDRENTDLFVPETKEYVAAIFNGWFLHHTYAFPPSPYLIPYFIGTHFNRDYKLFGDYSYLDGNVIDYLKSNSKIGCRDTQTMKILSQKGIDSYFSGCLTLTLKQFKNVQPDDCIILTDVSENIAKYIMKQLPKKHIIRKTHKLSQQEMGMDWEEREKRVEKYLKCYQAASLVVTTRLHCALPCIALGTPVILIGKFDVDYNDRIKDYKLYCNCYSESDVLDGKVDHIINGHVEKPNIKMLSDKMTENCINFVNSLSDEKYNVEALPELLQYKKLYIERAYHMRKVINQLLDIRNSFKIQHLQDMETMQNVINAAKRILDATNV